jgi:hypothetical protein
MVSISSSRVVGVVDERWLLGWHWRRALVESASRMISTLYFYLSYLFKSYQHFKECDTELGNT